jgi:tripartite-type tricarboxylate transporter receptor subunit TctC
MRVGCFSKRVVLLVCIVAFTLLVSVTTALAADKFPARPIEFIVPYTAGGSTDLIARVFASSLEKLLGGTVLVVNKPGAGGVIGFTYIATARADGYTMGVVPLISLCVNGALGDMKADPVKDYIFLGSVSMDPLCIAVSKDSPFNNITELLEFARSHPNELSYGVGGRVGSDAVTCWSLENAGNALFNMVSFDGGGDTIAALLGGHIQIISGAFPEMISYLRDGEIKVLATGAKNDEFPDVKTFEEQGLDMPIVDTKRVLVVPKGIAPDLLSQLVEAVKTTTDSDEYKMKAKEVNLDASYISNEQVDKEAQELMDFFANNADKFN